MSVNRTAETSKAEAPEPQRSGAKTNLVTWKAGVGLSILALAAVALFVFAGSGKTAQFRITDDAEVGTTALVSWILLVLAVACLAWKILQARKAGSAATLFEGWNMVLMWTAGALVVISLLGISSVSKINAPSAVIGPLCAVVMVALAAYVVWLTIQRRKAPSWVGAVFTLALVIGFMVWFVASGTGDTPSISLSGLVGGGVTLAVPLVFGSLAGVMSERVGVVNIAIEGQLLFGAFSAAVVGSITKNVFAGLLAAAVAGALVSLVLALVSIKYLVNQIIVGVVLNVLVSGLTSFLFSTVLTQNAATLNSPPRLEPIVIPLLSDIPLLGPILFKQSLIGYLMYVAVIVVYIALFHTRWGLRVRAVGEHPKAADTVGINVNRTRFINVTLGGAIAGIGGAYFTLVAVDAFSKDMSSGRGYIALAALIFGRWNPIGAALAALLFGFADNLQQIITIIGSPLPTQFMAMLPYVLTIIAVAGLVGRSRPPASSGQPYVKG